MRTFSSADAKNHFGELIDAARLAPVAITKYDEPFVVFMGYDVLTSAKNEQKGLDGRARIKG